MNPRILNRAGKLPEDGFYQIETTGEHINHRARVIQVIDAAAVTAIVNRFQADATAQGENWAGQQIYKDHLGNSEDNPTEALGWAMELRNRNGVPEARIDWTNLGLPLVESKPGVPPVYKFFSTEYNPAECEVIGTRTIKNRAYKVVRPLRLDGLSLTNDPNNKGQHPISNRNGNPADAADENENQTTMKSLLKKLGLAEDASEESAVAALQAIQNRASQVEALTTERDALLTAQVESDLEKYKNRFKAENRDTWKAQLIANRKGTIALLESIEVPAVTDETTPAPITNRAAARTPAEITAEKNASKEKARGAKIANRAAELRVQNPRLSRALAFSKAEAELGQE